MKYFRNSMVAMTAVALVTIGFVGPTSATAVETHSADVEASANLPTMPQQKQVTYRQLIRNRQTQRCLTSNSAGTVSTSTPCTANNPNQVWYTDQSAPLRIWNQATGRCLSYSAYAGSGTGAVWTTRCDGSVWQQWRPHAAGWLSTWSHFPYRYLDSNSQGSVYTLPGNGSYNQLWQRIYF